MTAMTALRPAALAAATLLGLLTATAGCGSGTPPGGSSAAGSPPAVGPSGTAAVTATAATTSTPAYRAQPPTAAALRAAFDYDPARPLDVTTGPATDDPALGVRVTEVGYDDGTATGGRAEALLVTPVRAAGRLPGVVFAHGSGASRRTFLDEAKELASRGAVALLPGTSMRAGGEADEDLAMVRRAVLVERRGLDLLAGRADVDPGRLGFVGHSWGATQAAVLAGVDARLAAVVVAATGPRFSEFLLADSGARDPRTYLDRLAVADPLWHLALPGRRGVVFLQHGSYDSLVKPPDVAELHSATAQPVQRTVYDAGHDLHREPAARRDRIEFLTRVLGAQYGR